MADIGTDRILATKVTSPIQGYDRGTGSLHEDVKHLGRERTLSVRQGAREKGGGERKSAQPTTIVVIEQWICLVLGLLCMAFGIGGDLYEARTGCSFCIHCMAGFAICADVADNGSRLRRIGRNADTPRIGASLIVFSISSSWKITAIFSQGLVCDAEVFPHWPDSTSLHV